MTVKLQERVLVLAPGRDGELTRTVLGEAGILCLVCGSVDELCHEFHTGAGVILLAEEVLTEAAVRHLNACLSQQPPWSDVPIMVIALTASSEVGLGAGGVLQALDALGNVSILARPLPLGTIVTAVRSALRARRRQYEVRDLLDERDREAKRKDEYLAMLAHELRNPLAPVRNAVHILRLQGKFDGTAHWAFDTLERQVRHMTRLIDDLLDVARIAQGQVQLRKESVDLEEVVRRAISSVQPLLNERRQLLSVEMPKPAVRLHADPERLEQVVTALLDNASRYTPPGGRVWLSGQGDGATALLKVRDNGIGMLPDLLAHAFEPFVQAERPLDRSQGGLGLGLAMVKGLVEQHDGRVEAHSSGPGQGSEVVVRLPALPARVDAQAPGPVANGTAPARHLKVLLVEDNRDGAVALASLLQLWGHEVRVVHDGLAGLHSATEMRPDVALLDIGLPGLDGFSLAGRLRSVPALHGMLLIALTGYSGEKDRLRARLVGFDHYLTKPADPLQLEAILAQRSQRSAPTQA